MHIVGYYKDLITGKNVPLKVRGQELSDEDDFHYNGDYRQSKSSESCSNCMKRDGMKCRKLGISNDPANDISMDHVCNFFKPPQPKKLAKFRPKPKTFQPNREDK